MGAGHHHHHGHGHGSPHEHEARRNIGLAFFLNLGMASFELAGGLLTGSVAIIADSIHDFGDSLSLGVAYILERMAGRKRDRKFTYGYKRFSLLGALVSGIVLLIGCVLVLMESVPRFWQPHTPHAPGMALMALFGVVVNGFVAYRLSHGKTMNEKVLSWHMIEDVMGWAMVLVGSLVMLWKPLHWIDPLMGCLLAVYIFKNAVVNLRETLSIFLQSVPPEFREEEFLKQIRALPGVRDHHDLHVWSLDGAHNVLSLHLVLADGLSNEEISAIKKKVSRIASQFGHFHLTLETEYPHDPCSSRLPHE